MTRWLTVATVAALVLTGCSDSDTEPGQVPLPDISSPATGVPASPATLAPVRPSGSPAGDVPAPVEAGVGGDPAAMAGFTAVVREKLPEIANDRRDEEISSIAEQACVALAGDRSADDVIAGTRSLGTLDAVATDEATARELIKLAIDTVCPAQARRVGQF